MVKFISRLEAIRMVVSLEKLLVPRNRERTISLRRLWLRTMVHKVLMVKSRTTVMRMVPRSQALVPKVWKSLPLEPATLSTSSYTQMVDFMVPKMARMWGTAIWRRDALQGSKFPTNGCGYVRRSQPVTSAYRSVIISSFHCVFFALTSLVSLMFRINSIFLSEANGMVIRITSALKRILASACGDPPTTIAGTSLNLC